MKMNSELEYLVVEGKKEDLQTFLNSYGKDGWELCVWERYIDTSVFIFTRFLTQQTI